MNLRIETGQKSFKIYFNIFNVFLRFWAFEWATICMLLNFVNLTPESAEIAKYGATFF